MSGYVRSLVMVALLSIGLPSCADGGTAQLTSTTASASQPDSTAVAQLEAELATVREALASSETQSDSLERTVAQLERELAAAREQARRATAESAAAGHALDSFESLLEMIQTGLCAPGEPIIPAEVADELVTWLRDTEAAAGDVPDDTRAALGPGVTADGWWLFRAEFNMRFEPGLFLRSPSGLFTVTWGGIGDSEASIRAWVYASEPSMPPELPLCIDVVTFVDDP